VAETTWTRPIEAVGLFLHGHTVRTAIPTAGVVGTLLSAVNQGAVVVGGDATVGTWLRIAFNYVVPFVVASVGYLSARRVRDKPG
jgi:NAD kinase